MTDKEMAARSNSGKPKLSYNMLGLHTNYGESYVWENGAIKYLRGNWLKGRPYSDCLDSLNRHVTQFLAGEDYDVDPVSGKAENGHSGCAHVYHIVCCAKILAESWSSRPDLDDRPKPTQHRAYKFDMQPWSVGHNTVKQDVMVRPVGINPSIGIDFAKNNEG